MSEHEHEADQQEPAGPETKVPLGGPIEDQPEPEIETHEGAVPVSDVDNPSSNPMEQTDDESAESESADTKDDD